MVLSIKSAARSKGAGAFVDQGIISGFNFLTFLLLARWLPTETFGVYVLAYTALMFVQSFQHALITRAHNVLGAGKSGAEYTSFSRSVLLMILLGIATATVLTGLLAVAFHFVGAPTWALATTGLMIAMGPWLLQDAIRRLLYTAERMTAAAWNDAVSYVLQAGAIAWLFLGGYEAGLLRVFLVMGGSSLAAVSVGWVQLNAGAPAHNSAFSRKTFVADLRDVWAYGKWLSSGELVGWIGQNGNTWLIGGLLGAPLVAGYRAATYVTNLLNPFDLAVSNYLPVRASRVLNESGPTAMRHWLIRKVVLLGLPYAILALGISLFSQALLELFYDARYTTSLLALVLTISVWARFVNFLAGFARVGLMAASLNKPIFVAQATGLILFAILSTAAISLLGIAGAPIAKIMLGLILGVYLSRTFQKGLTNLVDGAETPDPSGNGLAAVADAPLKDQNPRFEKVASDSLRPAARRQAHSAKSHDEGEVA